MIAGLRKENLALPLKLIRPPVCQCLSPSAEVKLRSNSKISVPRARHHDIWDRSRCAGTFRLAALPTPVESVTHGTCYKKYLSVTVTRGIFVVTLLRGILSSCQTYHNCQLTWIPFSIFWMNISHQRFARSSLHSFRTPSHSSPHSYPSSRPSSHPNLGNGTHKLSYHRSSAF